MQKEYKYEESSRPPLYRAMKYWGKKPHNIWNQLIVENSKPNDIIFDPFSGSAITFFESIKTQRKPLVCDINPISEFIVDVYSREYSFDTINEILASIISNIRTIDNYKYNYRCLCSNCGSETDIYNHRWQDGKSIGYSYKCSSCKKTTTVNTPINVFYVDSGLWKPSFNMSNLKSIKEATLIGFGGNDIRDIWTNRNLDILAHIFSYISDLHEPYKCIFMFAFMQTLHLTTKMCALRSVKTKRPLSTSWGRPAYMSLSKYMEQNPLVQFERSFIENNGVIKALHSRNEYLPLYSYSNKLEDINNCDGIALTLDVKKFNYTGLVDMIIADPPYGNIIQYGELSLLWNVWLSKIYPNYSFNLDDEIIVRSTKSYDIYQKDMTQVLRMCHRLLKDNGKCILTFNSNNLQDWYAITKAIRNSGFLLSKYYLQTNRRSSEANVAAKSGTAISDYYMILCKQGACYSNALLSEIEKEISRN